MARARVTAVALSVTTAFVTAGAAVLLGGNAQAASTNLLANPGFETGNLSSWTCDAGTGSVVTSPVHSGSYALAGAASNSDDAQCTQTVAVSPSTTYTLSGFVEGAYVYLGVTGGTSNWTPSATSWSQLSTTFTTSSSQTSLQVYVHGWYAQGTYHADDLSLTGGSNPPPTTTTTAPPTTTTTTAPPTTTTTTAPPTTNPPTTNPAGGLPPHVLAGYWQDFTNGATPLKLASVPSGYNLIDVAFAGADSANDGGVSFSLDSSLAGALGGYTTAQFIGDINTLHSRGQRVLLSVGGANGTVSIASSSQASNFADSVNGLIKQYGFDGVDIDFENGLNVTYTAQALQDLASLHPGVLITLAPQTIDMYQTSADYFQLALDIKSILTISFTQYYNSGSMPGCDGNIYSEGNENFLTALACTQLQGGLNPSQVGLGLPASTSAAGSGYVSPSVVNSALSCLAARTSCGGFTPPSSWPGIGGAMDWSINWDASNGYSFVNTVAPHLASLP